MNGRRRSSPQTFWVQKPSPSSYKRKAHYKAGRDHLSSTEYVPMGPCLVKSFQVLKRRNLIIELPLLHDRPFKKSKKLKNSTSFYHMHERRIKNPYVSIKFKLPRKSITHIQSKWLRQCITWMPRKTSCSQKSEDLQGWGGEGMRAQRALVDLWWKVTNSIPHFKDETEGQRDKRLHSFIHRLCRVFRGCGFNDAHEALSSRNPLTSAPDTSVFPLGFKSFWKAPRSFSSQLLYVNKSCYWNTI